MIADPLNSALIAELVSAPTGHVIAPLILLNPEIALVTFLIITACQKIKNRLIFLLIFKLLTRLARMRLFFAVQAVALGAAWAAVIDHLSLADLNHVLAIRSRTVHHIRVHLLEISQLLLSKSFNFILISQSLFYVELVNINLAPWTAYREPLSAVLDLT